MSYSLYPLLSEEDRGEASEGGLDPLGLVQVAEALAVRLASGVRERMVHPRYLTAIAVGIEVCRRIPEDAVAQDGVSPPWLVFEWIAVEAFARTAVGRDPFKLPGSEKAAAARRAKAPLSSTRYLKSPRAFGFHGVYRGLADELSIEHSGRLGEIGYSLLTTWAKEQCLEGFTGTSSGTGSTVCAQLFSAVRDSMQKGAVARSDGWQYWKFFRDHLSPHQVGKKEAEILSAGLFDHSKSFRGEVLRFLISEKGRKIFEKTSSEREFHDALNAGASPELKALLTAISLYERFSRLCQDAFDDILLELTRTGPFKVTPQALGAISSVAIASRRVPEIFGEIVDRLSPFPETARFSSAFASLAERADPGSWADRLLSHHVQTQNRKPPNGKSPWFERFGDGSVIIRPLYRRDWGGRGDDRYLHAYRTVPLFSFAKDLHLISV